MGFPQGKPIFFTQFFELPKIPAKDGGYQTIAVDEHS